MNMRKFLSIVSLLFVLTGVALLSSCKKEKEIVHVGQVTLDQTSLEMVEGATAQLVATVLPAEAEDKTLEWSSNDVEVATVSDKGLVSALKPGTAVIKATAKDGGIAASCEVTVTKRIIAVTGITLDKTTLPITIGGNYTLDATIAPPDATDKSVTWASDDTDVAMVDNKGKVVGVGVGTAHVTATSVQNPDITATCTVEVSSETVAVTGISLDKETLNVEIGRTQTIVATVEPENATNQNVRWGSDDEAVATVVNGKVTGVKKGTANITATTVDGGFSKKCAVTVVDNAVSSIRFQQASSSAITVDYGSTYRLDVIFDPADASNKSLDWTMDLSKCRIKEDHLDEGYVILAFDGSAAGIVTVIAASQVTPSAKASQQFNIRCYPTAITLSPAKLYLAVGGEATYNISFTPSFATQTSLIISEPSDPSVFSIDNQGKITGLAVGSATLTVTSQAVPTVSATLEIEVLASNKVSINGGEAVNFVTGQLGTLLQDVTVTDIAFQGAVLNAADIQSFYDNCRTTLKTADFSSASFLADGGTYQIKNVGQKKLNDPNALPDGLFYYFTNMTKLRIPAVKKLGAHSISYCDLLEDLVLPETLEIVAHDGLRNCPNWTLTLPSSIKTIESYAFSNSKAPAELDLSHVENIQNSAFNSVKTITKVWFGKALKVYNAAFQGANSSLTGFYFKEENPFFMSNENGWLFSKNGKTLHTIPKAARGGTGSVTVPAGVETIKGFAADYGDITYLSLPEGLKYFEWMYSFGHLKIADLTLPSTLEKMSGLTFAYSDQLKTVTVKATTPPDIINYDNLGAFGECSVEHIYVPAGSVDAYKAAKGWSVHASIISAITE